MKITSGRLRRLAVSTVLETLLRVVRTGGTVEDLRSFLNRMDATIAGMETPPDDFVLIEAFFLEKSGNAN